MEESKVKTAEEINPSEKIIPWKEPTKSDQELLTGVSQENRNYRREIIKLQSHITKLETENKELKNSKSVLGSFIEEIQEQNEKFRLLFKDLEARTKELEEALLLIIDNFSGLDDYRRVVGIAERALNKTKQK